MNADPGPLKACWPPAPTPMRATTKAARHCTWPPLPPARAGPAAAARRRRPALKTEGGRDVLSLARKVRADVLAGEISLWILKGCSQGQAMLKAAAAGGLLALAAGWRAGAAAAAGAGLRAQPLPVLHRLGRAPAQARLHGDAAGQAAGRDAAHQALAERALGAGVGAHRAGRGYFIEGHVPAEDILTAAEGTPPGAWPGGARPAARRARARELQPGVRHRLHHPRQRRPRARHPARGVQHDAGGPRRQGQRCTRAIEIPTRLRDESHRPRRPRPAVTHWRR
jgi:hypothetical protein